MDHMGVTIEVWPIAADSAGIWLLSGDDAWRTDRIDASSTAFFEVDLELVRHSMPDPVMVHSTSWREEGQRMVATFLAVMPVADLVLDQWPDARPISGLLLDAVGNPAPHDPADQPAPRRVDVLMHGLRHLAFLRDTDATARAVLAGVWARHLGEMAPALAGMYQSAA